MKAIIILGALFIQLSVLAEIDGQLAYDMFVPKVSVITSLYKGGSFIKGFMEDIVKQTIFDVCEFLIISAHSPDEQIEDALILPYVRKYPNIIYIKLAEDQPDPGLYGVWNIGIKLARAHYIMNGNVDDRLAPEALEVLSKALDEHPEVDLVYSSCYIGRQPNETFATLHARPLKIILDWPDFTPSMMQICLPGNHPMWRKTIHEKCGFFDDSYKAAGDWEFFLRAVESGCIFMKVPLVLGTFYENTTGLTRSKDHGREMGLIEKRYGYIWHTK